MVCIVITQKKYMAMDMDPSASAKCISFTTCNLKLLVLTIDSRFLCSII